MQFFIGRYFAVYGGDRTKGSLKKRIAAGIAALSLLSGCGKSGGNEIILYDPNEGGGAENKISLTFFGYKADSMNLTATEAAMQSFMAGHRNIDITYEGIKGLEYWDAFDKRDAAGVLDDIVMMHHDHVIAMSAEGKLADLSDIPGLSNYTYEVRDQFTSSDGAVYFLPTSISTYNLYINYDILKAHGQSVPEDWESFQSCCDHFVSCGIVPIIANNRNSITTLIISKGLFEVYQSSELDDILRDYNKNPALLAEALAPGVEQATDMIARGWLDTAETLATEQTSDDLELFLKGDRPFMISGGWASTRVMAKKPSFDYGVHPYPILDDGCVISSQVDTCISVNARSKNVEAAKEFIAYLIQPDVMWDYCVSQASYTPLIDERNPSEKTLKPSSEYLTNGRIVFRNDYRLDLPMETALAECAKTLLNGGTANEAKAALAKILTE